MFESACTVPKFHMFLTVTFHSIYMYSTSSQQFHIAFKLEYQASSNRDGEKGGLEVICKMNEESTGVNQDKFGPYRSQNCLHQHKGKFTHHRDVYNHIKPSLGFPELH